MEDPPAAASSVSAGSRAPFLDALEALARVLAELGVPSMVIGGVAVIALGVPRSTVDIDATVLAVNLELNRLFELAEQHGFSPRIDDAPGFARAHQVVLLEHNTSGIPVDITLASLPFEEDAIGSSTEISYAGIRINIPTPGDLLVYKLVAARPRDLEDAEKLLLLYGSRLDLGRLRGIISEFADALEDPSRLGVWDQMVQWLLRDRGRS